MNEIQTIFINTSFEVSIHALIYITFAWGITKITIKRNEKAQYLQNLENAFVYTSKFHAIYAPGGIEKFHIDILWLERNKNIFTKDMQRYLQNIFDVVKLWHPGIEKQQDFNASFGPSYTSVSFEDHMCNNNIDLKKECDNISYKINRRLKWIF